MLGLLIFLILLPLSCLLVMAIVFGFGMLLFGLLRFVLPFIILGLILCVAFNHNGSNRRKNWYGSHNNDFGSYYQKSTQSKSSHKRKDITNNTTRHDDDDWSNF